MVVSYYLCLFPNRLQLVHPILRKMLPNCGKKMIINRMCGFYFISATLFESKRNNLLFLL